MKLLNGRSEDGVDVALAVDTTAHLSVNGARIQAVIFRETTVVILCAGGPYVLSRALYQAWLWLASTPVRAAA